MSDLYECSRCGVVAETDDMLCYPRPLDGKVDYCGHAPDRGTLCEPMRQQLPYVCSSCGRPAKQSELLCDPLVIG